MKRAYIYTTLHPTKIRYGNTYMLSRKLDIADFFLDAASRNSTIVGAADGTGQLAECREDFSNKIP